ncbi:MAG: monovalent cation/H+ antiporter subunit D family protein [Gammaproteobacteria bacterium]|nr:monovalent cation/H+ antiporter subunit D family protein [Gammaproteobacteria bacterium]
MAQHLPALQVVLPLFLAPICVLLHRGLLAWFAAVLASWATFAIACLLLGQVLIHGDISYAMGGWEPPWGIEYRVDTLSGFILVMVTLIGSLVMTYARRSVDREIPSDRIYLFYTAYLLGLAGLLGVVITGDIFNLFVFIEISSLSSYALISLGRDRRALLAAYRYLILGTLGATFILIGIGYLYAVTGTLNMVDLAARLPDVMHTRTAKTALGFLTIGIALKSAIFPLHLWLPNAYTHAPSVVSAFLAGTTTKVYLYVLLRIMYSVFGADFVFTSMHLDNILLPLALASVVMGSVVAIYQSDLKRMLAYSSIAQIGYMALAISMASVTGVQAGILHMFNHAVIKTALFLCLGCVVFQHGRATIDSIAGAGKTMPLTMAAFVIAGLSLIGIPLTAGFISKWYLVLAAIEQGSWITTAVIVAASLLAAIYIWRVIESAYFREPAADTAVGEAPLSMLIPLWLLAAGNIYLGIDTQFTVPFAGRAAAALMGVAP